MSAAVLEPTTTTPPPRDRRTAIEVATGFLGALEAGQSLVIAGVSWDDYVWFDRQRDEANSAVRLAYSDGRLELMTTSFYHDSYAERLNGILIGLGLASGIEYWPAGRTTYRKQAEKHGFEPDHSYYIRNYKAVADLVEIDLDIHPPPDLVIEVDHTNSSLPKLPIYARFLMPEVWRFEDDAVTMLVLGVDGKYETQSNSLAFPAVTAEAVTRLILEKYPSYPAYLRAVQNWAKTLPPQA